MNRLTFILATTTVVFASTTVYFARAFYAERPRAAPARVVQVPRHPTPSRMSGNRAAPSEPVDSAPARQAPSPVHPASGTPEQIAFSQARLNRLTDPQARAEQLTNLTALLRRNFYTAAQGAGWTREDLDRVAAMLAERTLQRMEARLRCELGVNCVPGPNSATIKELDRQEMAVLLGEEKVARYEQYLGSTVERNTVGFMRTRLSEADPLSDTQAERLINALTEENHRFTEAAKLEGTEITTEGLEAGRILAAGKIQTAEGRARMLESGTEYARRLHDRAAEILTPAQLIEFDEMQEETLRSLRERLKFDELRESTRTAQ
jgi:hypothetical protein